MSSESERRIYDLRNLVNGLYNLGQTIGTGHFAVVKLARHVFTQKEVAVKVIDKTKLDEISKAHLFQEVQCMKLVQHPNVVRLYEVIDTPNKLYLILEFADGGDMYDYITRHANGLNESLSRKYFRQICRALKYCHKMYVCHRDLKPENIVFFEKQGVVKLTDFGFSNLFSPGKKLLTSCGSLAYSAPEILLGDPYDAPAVDIWSLGVILFMLVTGRAPFQEANDSETVMMILDCSYKVPSHISSECQSLIYRMIVREPEKRATLDEVISDIWYRQCEDDDNKEQHRIDSLRLISHEDHELIIQQMIDGNIANKETISTALNDNQYNHMTATYYLLAEQILCANFDKEERNVKRQRCSLQPADDPFKEQIGAFISPTMSSTKENASPILTTPRHSFDSSSEQVASVENDDERLSLQQRGINTSIPGTPAQAMKIILEEDENPESPQLDVTGAAILQSINFPKLNKIIENEDEDDRPSEATATPLLENSTTTSGILRSKDLRSAVEIKRRNFSHSCSSSDSEDNGSSYDMNRLVNSKHTRSPNSFQESESIIKHRGRSMSNIENISREIPHSIQQQIMPTHNSESMKRKNFSRTSSITSTNRLIINHVNDGMNADLTNSSTLINDHTRSLSTEHRFANPSQMSIASRTSIRHSTPRESIVFTKTDAPNFIRLLQQKQHQDIQDVIPITNETSRLLSTSSNLEHVHPPIIAEEDISSQVTSTSTRNINSPFTINTNNNETNSDFIIPLIEHDNIGNAHALKYPHSVLSRLKYSLTKQKAKSSVEQSTNINAKQKRSSNKHGACCTIS
ncbi:unnamed protein product [Rotaria socialis]|uniref:SNF-related serine/threonine-protein kinase n=1 Tax=Rotaria socialis TaxID=392032 RepID=A0A820U2R0_9BILA|nr:unnamed protein product [Rotaria socialis]CAF4475426.1 unnamed protein product [Rotaria socialis]